MIIVTCIAVPHPGMEEEARAAAREITEASQNKKGMSVYFWSDNPGDASLRLVEVHENPDSVVNHISTADPSRLAAAASFTDIEVMGDASSPEMDAALGAFGDVKMWARLLP